MAWARVTSATLGAQTATNPNPGTTWAAGSLGTAVSVGHKIIASLSVWQGTNQPTVSSITDSLGNGWTKDFSITTTDGTGKLEFSIWSAIVTVAGTPAITVHFTGLASVSGFGVAIAAGAYSGLSVLGGASDIDVSKFVNGIGTTADSGTTVSTTGIANELKVGVYQDDGWSTTLTAGTLDTSYSIFQKIDANANAQALVEDHDSGAVGSTARAEVGTGTASANWGMGVVVYKLAAGSNGVSFIASHRPFPFVPSSGTLRGF